LLPTSSNEEQSGINYPARYLGKLANPFLPDYIDVTPLHDNAAYRGHIHLSPTQRAHVIRFRAQWQQAIPAVFAQFRALGYSCDPVKSSTPLSYAWSFGDGTTASGVSISHTYKTAGNYILTLAVTSPGGKRIISKAIHVRSRPTIYENPYSPLRGKNRPNPRVTLPKPKPCQDRSLISNVCS